VRRRTNLKRFKTLFNPSFTTTTTQQPPQLLEVSIVAKMMNIEHLFQPESGGTDGGGGAAATASDDSTANPNDVVVVVPPSLPRPGEMLFGAETAEKKLYWDRSHYDSPEAQMKALEHSSTLYVGNLAFSTRSHHLLSHFGQVGPVVKVVIGLDRFHKTPCGFGFVEYRDRRDALQAVANLTGTKLDGRPIRVELDAGFKSGREYGRGASGGQVRDEKRKYGNFDEGRTAKRQKPLQWTPPEHVQQQQEQQPGGSPEQQQQEEESSAVGTGIDEAPPASPNFNEAETNQN
jgi:nuclear cap-binding protein subunit 2